MRKFRLTKLLAVVALALAFGGAMTMSAQAFIIDFGIIAPTAGSISFAGGATPLVGSGIEVDNVVGLMTPSNSNVALALTNAVLNFTTGNFIGVSSGQWLFGGGGSISIVGNIPALGLVGATLLTGTFSSAVVDAFSGVFKITGASFSDYKNAELLAYYGIPNPQMLLSGNFNISFNAAGLPGDPFTSSIVLSGDVINTPIPASLVLMGGGLLGLVGLGWRRRKS